MARGRKRQIGDSNITRSHEMSGGLGGPSVGYGIDAYWRSILDAIHRCIDGDEESSELSNGCTIIDRRA